VSDPAYINVVNWNWFIPSTVVAQYPGWGGNAVPTDPRLKYWTLRPRPVDQLLASDVMNPGQLWPPNNRTNMFPPPEDAGGDVKNLTGNPPYIWTDPATGQQLTVNNDSIWIDLGAPVMVAPDGKKYKALFAPLIMDLDGRVNLNVHGNIRIGNTTHASNQGWGPWEINVGRVLAQPGNPPEWVNLFMGSNGIVGRYGQDQVPGQNGQSANFPGTGPHFYSQIDFDGSQSAGMGYSATAGPIQIPTAGSGNYSPFPTFPQGYYTGAPAAAGPELSQHPLLFGYFQPAVANGADDRTFRMLPANPSLPPPMNKWQLPSPAPMEALLRYGDMGSPSLYSELFRLLPTNFSASSKVRNLVTTHSMDLDRLGLAPWVWDPTTAAYKYQVNAPQVYPTGAQTPFPPYQTPPQPLGPPPAIPPQPLPAGMPPPNALAPNTTDFASFDWNAKTTINDWRAAYYLTSTLGRLDLNQTLAAYPALTNGQFDLTVPQNVNQLNLAITARQAMARKIFNRLCAAVGAVNPLYDPSGVEPSDTSATTQANPAAPKPGAPDYDALRWLAQLAVNIVDYIDEDDISTAFKWNPPIGDPTNPNYDAKAAKDVGNWWVFGTEMSHAVLNEVYAEIENDPQDLAAKKANNDYWVNFWVELHNPFNDDPQHLDGGLARLEVLDQSNPMMPVPLYAPYQVVITTTSQPAAPFNPALHAPDNVLGDPDPTTIKLRVDNYSPDPAPTPQPTLTPVEYSQVRPAKGQYAGPDQSNQGFYMLGPGSTPQMKVIDFPVDPNNAPNPAAPNPTLRVKTQKSQPQPNDPGPIDCSMSYTYPKANPLNMLPTHTLLLRRLACPYLPPQSDPTQPGYNPYVTVDYSENVPLNNGVQFDPTGATPPGFVAVDQRASVGRAQPWAAHFSQLLKQQPLNAANNNMPNQNEPQHTFFRHNARESTPPPDPKTPNQTLTIPFNWLVHLDRNLISPMELLHVSGYKPHELTQQFVSPPPAGGAPTPYQQYAPWTDPASRIYRALDFLKTHELATGVPGNGRIPGKININTIWDSEIFEALCSAVDKGTNPNPNGFDNTQVQAMFQQLLTSRSQKGYPSGYDRPFRGMAVPYGRPDDPQYPGTGVMTDAFQAFGNGIGIDDTFLRPTKLGDTTLAGRLFAITTDPVSTNAYNNPYQQTELLTKIYNNLTTRSHVFAVWVTVGFFEVIDDSTRPVKLGAEIGRAENRQVRHKMFAIVDRSALNYNPGPQNKLDLRAPTSPGTGTAPSVQTNPPKQPGNDTGRVLLFYSIIQ
jgi:hypothetical protein